METPEPATDAQQADMQLGDEDIARYRALVDGELAGQHGVDVGSPVTEMTAAINNLLADRQRMLEMLQQPHAVWVNYLRGSIVLPWDAIAEAVRRRSPPPGDGGRLSPAQIADIALRCEDGALWSLCNEDRKALLGHIRAIEADVTVHIGQAEAALLAADQLRARCAGLERMASMAEEGRAEAAALHGALQSRIWGALARSLPTERPAGQRSADVAVAAMLPPPLTEPQVERAMLIMAAITSQGPQTGPCPLDLSGIWFKRVAGLAERIAYLESLVAEAGMLPS